jgi:FemAB-related protein (PEP-CTERM system-associated)
MRAGTSRAARLAEVRVERLPVGQRPAWDAYVRAHPSATHWHLSGWGSVIRESYRHEPLYLWAKRGDEIVGVLPMIRMVRPLFGSILVSLPFADGGGICATDADSRKALYGRAAEMFREYRARLLDLRHREPSGLGLAAHGHKVTLVLGLADTADRTWAGFDPKLRNQIRKAVKAGLTTSWTGLEGLDAFYDVFAVNMRELGSPVHGRRFFAAVLEEFADSAKLVLVRAADRVVAAGLCLAFRDGLFVPWAASLRSHRSSCPNNLLYWEVVRSGCEKGFRTLDFGRSSVGSGTYHFKRQWGAADVPLHWECLRDRPDRVATINPADGRYGRMAAIWKRLPPAVARRLGPPLRRLLSN